MADENKFNFASFVAPTFEDLSANVEGWLKSHGKRLLSISCYTDGDKHYAMLATNPTEVVICCGGGLNQAEVYAGRLMTSK
jgi:hypothetical protein